MARSVHGLHATDRPISPGQKTVTTVCGLRVDPALIVPPSDASCVGCRAILRERELDAVTTVNAPRIEDYWIVHHAECGGAVTGYLGGELRCGECGAVMSAFVSDYDAVRIGKPGPKLVPKDCNTR